MWRLQAGIATPSQEAGLPSAPDEGAALNGWTGLDERRRQCRPDNVRSMVSGPGQEDTVARPKIAAVERREVYVPVTRHVAPQGADEDVAPFGAPPPSCLREKGNEGAGPAPTNKKGR